MSGWKLIRIDTPDPIVLKGNLGSALSAKQAANKARKTADGVDRDMRFLIRSPRGTAVAKSLHFDGNQLRWGDVV